MFIVGIDVAKRSHEATIITSDGEIVQSAFNFRNNCSGYNVLLERVRKLTNQRNQIVFAMESTAHYWLALYARLTKDGYSVLVLNPIQPHALRDFYIRPLKTDARDSLIIADVVRFGRCKPSSIPQDKILALRELCRCRSYLMGMASDLKRKLIALLDQVFPEYETLFDSIFCRSSVAVLHRYPTPEKLKNAHVEKLCELLRQYSGGHFGEWKARQLKDAAAGSFGIDDCCGVYSSLISTFLRQIEELNREVDALEGKIDAMFSEFDNVLQSIPGVGPTLGAVILSEIGDVTRFASASKLLGYAGMDPSVRQSGEFTGTRNRMSKRGSPYLRRAIWMATSTAVHYDPMFRAYYEKKLSEGLHHMNAIGHATRKMTAVIFAVLRDGKPYQPMQPCTD